MLEAWALQLDASPEDARELLRARRFRVPVRAAVPPGDEGRRAGPPRARRSHGLQPLGPLTNPAGATHQVIGVADEAHLDLLGEALERLGARAGAIVHAASGIDEVAGDSATEVHHFSGGRARRYRIDPSEFGIAATASDIGGGEPAENARALHDILRGERSPRADVVALNAALALVVADLAESLDAGLERARESLHGGSALAVFESVRSPRDRAHWSRYDRYARTSLRGQGGCAP